MAYVNFKEERYKANIQLEKRKQNNKELYDYILKHKNYIYGYNPSKKFSFNKFEGIIIGKKGILSEENFSVICNEDIICSNFIDCKFTNVKFINCRFVACTFINCDFSDGGVVFENCFMIKADSDKLPSLNRKDNLSCYFNKCNIYAKFSNCDISYVIFEDSKIINSSFQLCAMNSLIIYNSEIDTVTIQDCDFSGGKIISTYIIDFSFEDKYNSKFDQKTFFDKIQPRVNNRQEYEGIYMTYQILADKFKENNLNNNFGEYYYLAKRMERKCIPMLQKVSSDIYWLTCGYGERPINAFLSGIVIILAFAIIYLFTGVEIDGEEIRYTLSTMNTLSFSKIIGDLNETINLSAGTFGGLGCINCKPTEISYFVTNIEIVVGILMMGLGIGALTRKIVR